MSFRRKLLLSFAITVFVSVGAVTLIVSLMTRRSFERANQERTTALVAQFRREFDRQGQDIAAHIQSIAGSERVTRMALEQGTEASGAYVSEAGTIAANQQIDFLELLDGNRTILSSAQSPAKFGYKDERFAGAAVPKEPFLTEEQLLDGSALAVEALREISVGEKLLYVVGGRKLNKEFLHSLELPEGTRAAVYQNIAPAFSAELLVDPSGSIRSPDRLAPIIQRVEQEKREIIETVHWSTDAADDEIIDAIPLASPSRQVLAVLLIGNSQRPYVELQRHIRSGALIVAGSGIFLAILMSGWVAGRVTRPVEELAAAARELSAGNWDTRVEVRSSDEIGQLADSFNRMTHELLSQKERLVQAERVAAWRELARRLAHELKNPLFPLQLTVENLVRAREQSPEQFEEVLRESSATLLMEIANLKAIISRFSDFSKMPQPQFQAVQINDIVKNAVSVCRVRFNTAEVPIECKLELADASRTIGADPDLLYRAISNLLLNALDAMPQGGTVTVRTGQTAERVYIEVADTGTGLTQEEASRLFTPYYTTKTHGTGLGLAIVQSVVSDHGGQVSVRTQPGRGTAFVIELPSNLDKLESAQNRSTASS